MRLSHGRGRVYHGRSLVYDLEIRANVDTTICANDKIPNVTEESLPLAKGSPTRSPRCENRATAEFLYCSNCVNPQVITPLILIYSQDTRLIYYCIFSLLFTLLLSPSLRDRHAMRYNVCDNIHADVVQNERKSYDNQSARLFLSSLFFSPFLLSCVPVTDDGEHR